MRNSQSILGRRFRRALFFNQMAGPLFRELAEGLAEQFPEPSMLFTGHPDTLARGSQCPKLRIKHAPTYNRATLLRRAISWFKYTVRAQLVILSAKPADLIVLCSNPPILTFIGALTQALTPRSFVTIVHDIYPDTVTRLTPLSSTSFLAQTWLAINRFFYERNLSVQSLSPGMAATLAAQFDPKATPAGSIEAVFPWADTDFIKPIPKSENPLAEEHEQRGKTTVLYSGNLGISHDIESMLEAALILKGHDDINFLFIGNGAKWEFARSFTKKHSLKNVRVLPFQPEKSLPLSMAMADIALVAMEKEAEGLMVPSKTFYYLAAGAAVIGLCSPRSDLAEIINKANCGTVLPAKTPQLLANEILRIHKSPEELYSLKQAARKSALTFFAKQTAINNTIRAISEASERDIAVRPAV